MKFPRSGFSLLEMLMVLMVVALISLSFFAFQKRGMEVDKSEDLGYRLYEYGQALGDYLRTQGRNYSHNPSDPTQLVYEGYEWLQNLQDPDGNPYLNKEFSLVVEPLYVENIPGQKTSLMTEISIIFNPATNIYELRLDLITVGPVYSRNSYTTDPSGVKTNVQDVSLIARAVNYANEYRDAIKGSGIIQYQRVELGAQEPPPGTEPPAPPSAMPSIIQGTMVEQGMWNDAWLLRSGHNTMQGPINFDNNVDSAITNITNIDFVASNGAVNGVQAINFGGSGTVANLTNLAFSNGAITGLSTITFSSGAVFTGMKNFFTMQCKDDRDCTVTYNGASISPDNYFCALTRTDDTKSNAADNICSLYKRSPGYVLNAGTHMICEVTCFQYR